MSRSLLTLAVLSCLASLVAGHICMWSPLQRGAMVLDSPGDPSCAHKGPDPCGKVAAGPALTKWVANTMVDVSFQQNLNHFFGPQPGFLVVEVSPVPNPTDADFVPFGNAIPDYNAMDEIAMANLTITGTVPNFDCEACVVRLTYQSRNPGENDTSTAFYQCADVAIVPNHNIAEEKLIHRAIPQKPADPTLDCCAPAQFEAIFQTASAFAPQVGVGSVSYDSVNKFMYYSVQEQSTQHMHYMNFSSGIEFNYDRSSNTCSVYGLDEWNDWCYGTKENEVIDDHIIVAGEMVNMWRHLTADFSFGAQADQCLPMVRARFSTSELTLYYNVSVGIVNPSIFLPPPVCKLHAAWGTVQTGTEAEIADLHATLPKSTVGTGMKKQCGAAHGKKHAAGKHAEPKMTPQMREVKASLDAMHARRKH